ncbi:hypothetical protein IF803_36075 [Bradyrhizobium sp. UFLA06-06]
MENNNIEWPDIDLRANNSGGVILLRDSNLGRTTDVGSASRAENYDPGHCHRLQTVRRRVQRHDQFAGNRGLCVKTRPERLGFCNWEENER